MKKIVLVCGLIAGFIVSSSMAISAGLCSSDKFIEGGMYIGYASMLLAFSLIFIGVKNFRDKQNNGTISFGKAFTIGIFISLIASTVYVLVWSIEYHFFFPDFMEKYGTHMLEKAKKDGATQTQINNQIILTNQYKEWYKSPFLFTILTYAEILPIGIIIALISALILKRKQVKTVVA